MLRETKISRRWAQWSAWRRRVRAILVGTALVLANLASSAHAETVRSDEATLKAAFAVRFLKYVEFPDARTSIRICTVGDDSVLEALLAYNGSTQGGIQLEVTDFEPDTAYKCGALFVSLTAKKEWHTIRALIAKTPTLTVGDDSEFVESGGIIQIQRAENALSFSVNLKSAAAARLKVSSKLLRLATEVVE